MLTLKRQQRFKNGEYNNFTEEINKITLSSIDDKIMQSLDSIEMYVDGTRKDLISKKKTN